VILDDLAEELAHVYFLKGNTMAVSRKKAWDFINRVLIAGGASA
jgi:hypothetical protein